MLPIYILLTEGYSDWEIAPLAGLGRAFYGADLQFVSPTGGALTSIAGLPIAQTKRFEPPKEGVVVVCGGPSFETDVAPQLIDHLCSAFENGCVIAGICGGTLALAHARLLDQVRHTSNGPGYLEGFVPNYAGTAHYVDSPKAVRDGSIITAPAPATASFATEVLIAAGLNAQAARQITALLGREHGG
ncbi:DJ-1/PfpI family protein [Cohaesibacter celericrescens]|uniref:DJ-1/PfpI domain-containing protein n=1 Tax=Cohaesibacter celericrescens TaxID=2067669 RepID=A0A2N5XV42_9HYPH|nr:DJ-1/PfpI family protein [Cohaesibacter celericrescens]PLW78364.1 hypothetical protein C0081_04520 [Cohaesibacter celericrescens]